MSNIIKIVPIIVILLLEVAFAQFSPGKLAKVHSFLEGTNNCTQCHEVGGKSLSSGCVECHLPIKIRIDQQKGLHKDKQEDCGTCHPDHNGLKFKLVYWKNGAENFDHKDIGFDLTDSHQKVECRKCHIQKNMIEESILKWIDKYPEELIVDRTWLGAANTCNGCHEDIHRGEVSQDCASCHTTSKWEESKTSYNHDLAKFQLTGEHQKVSCEKCHTIDKKQKPAVMKLTGLNYQTCGSCHTDIHKSAYGNTCEKCHTTQAGWTKNLIPFDHNDTKYPLKGRHLKQNCTACHTEKLLGSLPSYNKCSDCHVDKHQKQFNERLDQGACESCHTVDGFIPTSYTFADHNQSEFKIDGNHFAIPCVLCHQTQEKGQLKGFAQFKWDVLQCNSCHTDIHREQFVRRENPKLCETCHTTSSFNIVNFNHESTAYPLDGEHINVNCEKCHLSVKDRNGNFTRYYPIAHKCEDCHSFNEKNK
ncbi:MAG: hypothetical protein HOB40_06585 [Candidatus Marinimicrobia bacterium]|nr:hypothetical protein [Candidatus Neomarinimicrobiota bacterium]MBT3501372.1 hypothetical protein [Candidatus Neomarinimicrobiota bacterium]MBT3838364.1 hypothetical protein [Candidatus Neomarinimicrobiota bacterium]MBT3998862.1 hypothetical protein [Candidatus Neomarinimicrobiota bacterium]MBT4283600.1 hypothetical protein [Candidatus Neomarinimicrobiota bacterium]